MKELYIVSFGGSDSYRCYYDGHIDRVSEDIHDYLREKFPSLSNLSYFSEASISKVTPGEEVLYENYPMLDDKSVHEIEKRLKREVQTREDVSQLNNNPYADSDKEPDPKNNHLDRQD